MNSLFFPDIVERYLLNLLRTLEADREEKTFLILFDRK